jgi:hypothetical protein
MAWYKSGSVNVANGNAIVYGNGTLWVDVSILCPGDVWVGPDARLYEILSIQSNTQLTLASTYLGATANTQSYAIMPIGLLPSALAQQVKTTLSTANTALSQAVRFDANQNLTSGQKATARSNIGATAAADVGLGLLSKSVAGGVDVTLTTDEAANLFYEFTGALTANINVVVPGNVRQFFVRNATTGAYTLTVKTVSGTGVKVLQGARTHLECDGTNVLDPTSEGAAVAVDANGNVGIGTSAPTQALDVRGAAAGNITSGCTTNVGANSEPGNYLVTAPNGSGHSRVWMQLRTVVGTPTEGSEASSLIFQTQKAGALTEMARFDTSGNFFVGVTTSTSFGGRHRISSAQAEGATILSIDGGTQVSALFCAAGQAGYSNTSTAILVGKNGTTTRSINAGGTINASGADYAEYMTKADGCGEIAKGQIVGIDADGRITDKWVASVSFLIKSTDPSYVGGDVWGNEESLGIQRPTDVESPTYGADLAVFEMRLEAARQRVDRIAYCGQVPVNVHGAAPGQYVVPIQDGDGISGILVDDDAISFAQYRRAVGVVQNILADGRANVRVKVV